MNVSSNKEAVFFPILISFLNPSKTKLSLSISFPLDNNVSFDRNEDSLIAASLIAVQNSTPEKYFDSYLKHADLLFSFKRYSDTLHSYYFIYFHSKENKDKRKEIIEKINVCESNILPNNKNSDSLKIYNLIFHEQHFPFPVYSQNISEMISIIKQYKNAGINF